MPRQQPITNERRDGAIRNRYAEKGVAAYYREEGARYANPHFEQVRQLLIRNADRLDYRRAFDFCCGAGEVSSVVRELGYPPPVAADPYTQAAYRQRNDAPCLPFSFDDVIRGALNGHGPFSSVICSFALHLCPPRQLFPLVFQLFQTAPQLVIITPHKRPDLSGLQGVRLAFSDEVPTQRGKAVRLRSYRAGFTRY